MPKHTGIDLLVPGLLGPMPALHEADVVPKTTNVERALSKASLSKVSPRDYASTLFHLFGLISLQSNDPPTAPYCRLADGAQQDEIYWMQASPVHLRPDGDGLLLFDAEVIGITLDEAQQLADLVQGHFCDRGWRLEVYTPQHWYLGLEVQPDLQTSALSDVIGRNIDSFLPTGKDAVIWHALMNEVQMLLHTSAVNLQREGRGQLPINGLWLHGGGRYQPIEHAAYASVVADEYLARGMSFAAEINPATLSLDSAELVLGKGRHLVVVDDLERSVLHADPYAWVESAERFNVWIGPLLKAVRARCLDYVDIYPCNGQVFRITSVGLLRFWRRPKPLGCYASS